jgi:hypothetical protein
VPGSIRGIGILENLQNMMQRKVRKTGKNNMQKEQRKAKGADKKNMKEDERKVTKIN